MFRWHFHFVTLAMEMQTMKNFKFKVLHTACNVLDLIETESIHHLLVQNYDISIS